MTENLDIIEKKITDFFTSFFKSILFFLNSNNQSLFVSFIHYFIFIIGFIWFFFYSKPGDIYRILFFIGIFIGTISYFLFNRCFFTSIELNLCNEKNVIQGFIDKYFGEEIEGNITSKLVLSVSTVIIGLILIKDYYIFHSI